MTQQNIGFYDVTIPLWHQGRLVFGDAKAMVISPNPIPLDISQTEMEKDTILKQPLPQLKNQILLEARRDKALFSSRESLILKFSNRIQIKIEPIESAFLDMVFEFKGTNIVYRPKSGVYADSSMHSRPQYRRGRPPVDGLSLADVLSYDLFTLLTVRDFQLFFGIGSNSSRDVEQTADVILTGLAIDGDLDFSRKADWTYDHLQRLQITIFPDRMLHFLTKDGKPTNAAYRIRMTMR